MKKVREALTTVLTYCEEQSMHTYGDMLWGALAELDAQDWVPIEQVPVKWKDGQWPITIPVSVKSCRANPRFTGSF